MKEGQPAGAESGRDGARFWRVIAGIAVLLAGSLVALESTERIRKWTREDDAAALRQGRASTEAAAKDRQAAEQARSETSRQLRSARIQEASKEHPERFKRFEPQQVVRVLSSAPEEQLRGRQATVWARNEVSDPETGVAWKVRYSVSMLPVSKPGVMMAFEQNWVDAEHLTLVGSEDEKADFRAHPELVRVAESQDMEIAAGGAWLKDLRSRTPARVGDEVVILETDPRPVLRGRRGVVLSVGEPQVESAGGSIQMRAPDCEVRLQHEDSSHGSRTVSVNLLNLAHRPR